MSRLRSPQKEAGVSIFWTIVSAISSATGNFMTRCPKCSGKMTRVEMHEQAYTHIKRTHMASTARPTSTFNTEIGRRAVLQVRVVPVYDVCSTCGHRVRRKDLAVE